LPNHNNKPTNNKQKSMKKTYKNLLSLGLVMSVATTSFSQAINESFADVTTLAASGWVMTNLSTPAGTNPNWFQGDGTGFPANSGTPNEYVAVNYNSVAGANTISNWLITPSRTFQNGDVVSFFTRTVSGQQYADNLQVRLSVNGTSTNVGTTNTSVGDFSTLLLEINPSLNLTTYPETWTQYSFTVSGLPMPITGRVAFRYFVPNGGPSGANSDYIGIDDFVYTPVGMGSADVTVDANNHQYTIVPLPQVTPLAIGSTVRNVGTVGTTDAMLTAKIYLAPDFTTPVQTFTSPATTIAPAGNAALSLGTYTPSAIGDYYIEYTASCTGNTLTSADTSAYFLIVDDNEYARDNAIVTGTVGIGAGPVGYLGAKFVINTATYLDSVMIALSKPGEGGAAIGDSTKITIFNVASGLPTTMIGASPAYIFTAADTMGIVVSTHNIMATGGGRLMLAPGTYFVAVTEYNTNVGMTLTDDEFRPSTFYASWTGQPWTAVEMFGASFAKAMVIRPFLNTCPMIDVTTSSSALTITANQTGATYQWIDCGTGLAIAGETNMSYTATANGNYAVEIMMAGCADTSACVAITSVGIDNISAKNTVSIYPNPSNGLYKVELNDNSLVVVTNILGETVINERMSKGTQKINIQDQPNGIYLLKVTTGNSQQMIKVIKE
jgi:hypothetical protein